MTRKKRQHHVGSFPKRTLSNWQDSNTEHYRTSGTVFFGSIPWNSDDAAEGSEDENNAFFACPQAAEVNSTATRPYSSSDETIAVNAINCTLLYCYRHCTVVLVRADCFSALT